jgi:hypothetical protein
MHRLFAFAWGIPAVFAVMLVAGGCAPEVVPSSGPKPAISADQVMVYQKQPSKYEDMGMISANQSEGARWDERGDANRGFDSLKAKAAERGANGLLLMVDPAESDRIVTAGYHGNFYQVPVRGNPPTAIAKAIYVIKK